MQVYDEFKQLDINALKLNPKVINNIIFNLTQLE